ncbi:hypothetical protein JXB37_08170 [candidate division WOR-3 bacterium]|nr:hypothetical protein [candidate division WOR-3 bacterium]
MESVKVEQCPQCHGRKMNNCAWVRTGEPVRVYVRCADCGAFVARYTLLRYTSEQTYESLLRNLRRFSYASGKRCLQEIEEFGTTVSAEFERVCRLADKQPEQRPIVELIRDARAESCDPEQ